VSHFVAGHCLQSFFPILNRAAKRAIVFSGRNPVESSTNVGISWWQETSMCLRCHKLQTAWHSPSFLIATILETGHEEETGEEEELVVAE
jgi:hypothetical protein